MRKPYRRRAVIGTAVIICLVLAGWQFGWFSHLTVENVRAFSGAHPVLGPVAFVLVYVAAIIFFLPIIPFAILAGTLFGLWAAFAYIAFASIVGALAAFYIARHFGKGVVDRHSRGKFRKVHEYDRKIARNGFRTVLFIRLMPLLPFKTPNYLLGFTKVRRRDYFWGTVLGMLPESFVLALVGSTFASWSPLRVFGALVAVGMLLTAGVCLQLWFKRAKGEQA